MLSAAGAGTRLAGISIGVSLVVATLVILDRSLWPPRSALEKLPYVIIGGLLIGVALDMRSCGCRVSTLLAVVSLALILLWLAWPQLGNMQPLRSRVFWPMAGLQVAGIIVILRVQQMTTQNVDGTIMVGMAGIGLGGIAAVSGSLLIGELAVALASAVGGFLLVCLLASRPAPGPVVVFSAVIPLLGLTGVTMLLTEARTISIAVLIVIFFLARFGFGVVSKPKRNRSSVLLLGLRTAIVAAAAIGIAALGDIGDDLYLR